MLYMWVQVHQASYYKGSQYPFISIASTPHIQQSQTVDKINPHVSYHAVDSTNNTPCCGWGLWGTVQTRQEACEPTYLRSPPTMNAIKRTQDNTGMPTSQDEDQTDYHTALPTTPCTNTYAHTSTYMYTYIHAVPLYMIITIYTHVTYVCSYVCMYAIISCLLQRSAISLL